MTGDVVGASVECVWPRKPSNNKSFMSVLVGVGQWRVG